MEKYSAILTIENAELQTQQMEKIWGEDENESCLLLRRKGILFFIF